MLTHSILVVKPAKERKNRRLRQYGHRQYANALMQAKRNCPFHNGDTVRTTDGTEGVVIDVSDDMNVVPWLGLRPLLVCVWCFDDESEYMYHYSDLKLIIPS